jgi:hypothetical protein
MTQKETKRNKTKQEIVTCVCDGAIVVNVIA